jgi:hypothetical protein
MLKFLADTYGSIYCVHAGHGANVHGLGECFDQRADRQPARRKPFSFRRPRPE